MHLYFTQGSVATHLRCGGILCSYFIANFLHTVYQWQNFENWSIFGENMDKFGGAFSRCIYRASQNIDALRWCTFIDCFPTPFCRSPNNTHTTF